MSKEKDPSDVESGDLVDPNTPTQTDDAAPGTPPELDQTASPTDTGDAVVEDAEIEATAAEDLPTENPVGDEPGTDPIDTDEIPDDSTTGAEDGAANADDAISDRPEGMPGSEQSADEPEPEAHEPELAETVEDPEPAHAEAEPVGSGFGSTLLKVVGLIALIFVFSLWAGPKLTPHLPAWAGKYLNPLPDETKIQISDLQSRLADLEGQIAPLETFAEKISAIESTNPASIAAAVADAQATADDAIEATEILAEYTRSELSIVADGFGTADALMSDLRASVGVSETQLNAQVSGLEADMQALAKAFDSAQGRVPATLELQAAMQAIQTRVDGLAAAIVILPELVREEDTAAFATKAELSATRADIAAELVAISAATEAAKQIGSDALNDAENSVRMAAIRGAATTLMSRINGGLPYSGALSELEALSGVAAPEALLESAADGLAVESELISGFPPVARAAMAASSGDGGDAGSRITAWLESQVSARPTTPTDGTSTGAVLSRVEAALNAGDLPMALTEANQLPPGSMEAMSDWLGLLDSKVRADAALPDFIAATGGQG